MTIDQIPRKRACLVCVNNGQLLCIEMQDPLTCKRFWSVPGGEVEPGELPVAAAVRETLEETGYLTRGDASTELISHYPFSWNGRSFACETWWYRGELSREGPAIVDDADYLLGCVWIPVGRIRALFYDHPTILSSISSVIHNS